jgi:GNAT superfamily N-acetyltransferase
MDDAGIRLHTLDAEAAAARAGELADVLIDCVHGGASVSFMAPLSEHKALAFWRGVAAGVAGGERLLLVAEDGARRIVGTVQVVFAAPENQPHRADIAKMLVHRRARRRGVAAQLLAAAETAALQAGRFVLVLDTVTGGDAERLYARAGWQRVGVVPHFALMPDGTPCSTTFFCKNLRRVHGAADKVRP